jgi:hypothetical protein
MYSEKHNMRENNRFCIWAETFENIFARILHFVVVDGLFSMFCSVDSLLFNVLYVDR